MSASVVSPRARNWARATALAAITLAISGCSDSGRFEVNNPFASSKPATPPADVTSSISKPSSSKIASQPLPAPSKPATVASSGVSQGAGGLGAYRPSQDVTGSVPAPVGHWTWEGGTPIIVGADENVEAIGRKYGVPASAIMQANNITDPRAIRPGQRLVIPRYVSTAGASAHPQPAPAKPAVAAAHSVQAPEYVHTVKPGESLIGISRKYHVTLAGLAKANKIEPYTKVAMGDRLTIPGKHAEPVKQAAAAQPAKPHSEQHNQPAPKQVASAAPVTTVETVPAKENARVAIQGPVSHEPAAKAAEPTGAMPSFRWPVPGRIITAFGQNVNGAQNDGINLAVPEGTPVKAAEDGVVAYAGNELKGYGNLVLVRHSNGYVSAYANASELLVKRGDTVKRGQTIARAGQTGNVSSPQLHFEIRKGSAPVDPSKYLAGGNG
jgi:murein DD-endopeptidase MepM/ murein hydrolase activator NlpD